MRVINQSLDEVGDEYAEPGSRDWAIALRMKLLSVKHDVEWSEQRVRLLLHSMEEYRGYVHLAGPDGKPFRTYEEFVTARPPFGLGYSSAVMTEVMAERKTALSLVMTTPAARPQGRPTAQAEEEKGDVITFNSARGSDPEYLTARIKRDRPDIAERMAAGEYTSVRAAARDAGLVRERWSVPAWDVDAAARYLAERLPVDDLDLLISALRRERNAR